MDRNIIGIWKSSETVTHTSIISYLVNSANVRYRKTSARKGKATISHPLSYIHQYVAMTNNITLNRCKIEHILLMVLTGSIPTINHSVLKHLNNIHNMAADFISKCIKLHYQNNTHTKQVHISTRLLVYMSNHVHPVTTILKSIILSQFGLSLKSLIPYNQQPNLNSIPSHFTMHLILNV